MKILKEWHKKVKYYLLCHIIQIYILWNIYSKDRWIRKYDAESNLKYHTDT